MTDHGSDVNASAGQRSRRALGVSAAAALAAVAAVAAVILTVTGTRNRESADRLPVESATASPASSAASTATPWRYSPHLRPCEVFAVAPLEGLFGTADPRRSATDRPLKGCVVGFGTHGAANLLVEVDDHADAQFRGLKEVAAEEGSLSQVPSGCQESYAYVDGLLGPRLACLDGNLYLTVGWTDDMLSADPGGGDDQAVMKALGRAAQETLHNLRRT
ncbi:hypothetical protein ABZ671_16910 [Micromonospora sp. NPDC006766]|uniref:hypothetical protein n=1 Tax=Micromonospora sp. NPDC006766 TaxID=3154778 RepID=UPI0033E4CF5E